MKVVALVSGGKDSCYAMMRCIDYGHQIVALANLLPADDSVDELDSYMYQTVGHQIVVSYAECMGLPLFRRRIRGSSRHQELCYKVTQGDEVEDMFILLNEVKRKIPSVTAVSSGAIASDYQRLRVESVCSRLGLVSLAYLWKQDQTLLLEEMIEKGIVAITIKVATMGLVPAKHLGKELAGLHPHLLQMKVLYGINVCGEGGEYETLTLDCPLFTNARIFLDRFQVILHSPDSFAPVGILHPLAFHLEQKRDAQAMSGYSGNSDTGLEKMSSVHEVSGNYIDNHIVKCQFGNMTTDLHTTKKLNICISTTRRDLFSIGCWIQHSLGTSEDLQDDLSSVLRRIELQLKTDGFDWGNVLYIHLYISNMKNFTLANEIYVKYITEKKCLSGVPSRSTIELPLMQAGLGNAYVEVLVANDMTKRVLHVQSISCWAPSCIGPYSQATLHRGILYMAGQLGLDPPTMTLRSGGSVAELEQALENCEAVANCFNGSTSSSTVLFVIYCSASLTSCERAKIQQKIKTFLGPYEMTDVRFAGIYNPIFLYVLASDLPKGALVEIKPVLHIPENGSTKIETSELRPACRKEYTHLGFEYAKWHDSCCQKCIVHGSICIALISITIDVAAAIFTMSGQSSPNFQNDCSEQQTKSIARFCTYLLDKILLDNNFFWNDVTNLRVYYRTDAFVTTAPYLAFSETFGEFVKIDRDIEIGEMQIFNLIPVLGSGSSPSMDDVITCELFATKI